MTEPFPTNLPPELVASRTEDEIETYFGDPDFVAECVIQWREKDAATTNAVKQAIATGATKEDAENASGKKSGAFGSVYKVNLRNENYFVKRVMVNPATYIRYKSFALNELFIAIKLTVAVPDAVSKLIGAVYLDNFPTKQLELYLIFEGPAGYDLFDYLTKLGNTEIQVDDPVFSKIYCSIKTAQVAINNAGYVHRDIKPENIFVQVNPADGMSFLRCKLIDLGLTVKTGAKVSRAGTPGYWPSSMNSNNTYARLNNGRATTRHNEHSLDVIWRRILAQSGPPPSCGEEKSVKNKKDGGRRMTRKRSLRRKA